MSKKFISIGLILCFLFTMLPVNALAQNEKQGEEKTGITIETIDEEGTLRITVPIKNSDLKLIPNLPNTVQKAQSRNRNDYTIQKIEPNVPTQDGAGQKINAAAAIFWDVDYWKFPKNEYKAFLEVAEPGPDQGKRFAETTIVEPATGLTDPDSVNAAVVATNYQFITTDEYKVGFEKKQVAAVYEVRLKFNARVSGGESSNQNGDPNGIIYYIGITQISVPVYTTEWFDIKDSNRPKLKGRLGHNDVQKEDFDLFEKNLKFGSIIGNGAGEIPIYVDEDDMNGKHIGYMNKIGTPDWNLPSYARRDISVEKFGSFNKDRLTLTKGQDIHLLGKFLSYDGVEDGKPSKTEVKQLGNTDGKINEFTKREFDEDSGDVVTKKYPAYFYKLVGDNDHLWRFQMREVLNVKLNSGAGKVNGSEKQLLHVGGKDTQEIGHSEKIDNKEIEITEALKKSYQMKNGETEEAYKERVSEATQSQRVISFAKDETITAPKVKIGGKDVDTKFVGWATKPQTLTDGKLSDIEGKLVNANGTLTDAGKAFTFTAKETILYAVFQAPQEGKINVKYVDTKGTDLTTLDPSVKIDGQEYPEFALGQVGESVKEADITEPKFIGYKRTSDNIEVTGKTYKKADKLTNDDTVIVKYEKIDDIIGPLKPTDEFPDGYVAVKFFADDSANDRGEFTGNKKELVYAVNPINTTIDTTAKKLSGNDANGDAINVDFPTYSVKQASQDTWKTNDTAPWVIDPKDAIKADKKIDIVKLGTKKDLTFTAQYLEKDKHTVTFDADNGTTNTTEKVVDGQTATKPTTNPTKNGYTFKEWQLVNNGNVSGTAYDFTTPVKSDITLKAVYDENDVKFEYVSEDTSKGTVDKAEETIKAVSGPKPGDTLGSTATAANGYRFTHWTKDGDKNFKVETAQLTPEKTNGIYVAAKFTAHFAKEIGVVYDLNVPTGFTAKGTAPTDDKKYIKGEEIKVKALGNATVEGWEFLGWNTNKDAKTAEYKADDKMAVADQTEDITLHAIWKKQEKGVKFEFKFFEDKNGNVTATTDTKGYNPDVPNTITNKEVGSEIILPTLKETSKKVETKDYQGTWEFKGWFTDEACKKEAKNPTVSATDSENKFYGKWVLTEDPKAKVHYEFTIDPAIVGKGKIVAEDHKLPDGVKKQLKNAEEEKYIGSKYQPSTRFREVAEKINGKDGKWKFIGWEPKSLTVDKDDSKNKFVGTWTWYEKSDEPRCMTPAPEMNPVYDSDEYITGRGIAGAVIEVRYRDYPILRTKVDTFGEWEVYTPYPLEDEQFVYARQIKEPCDPSVWVSEEIRYDDEYWRKDDKKEEPKKPVEIKKVWTPAELNARDHFSYIKGYGDNTFGPNRTITRAEVAMIFARLSINQSVSGAPKFTDVKPGDWYRRAVDIVARQGVVKGYEDGTFRPNQPITRREFAAIAARYAGNIDAWRTFRDVPATDWAYTLINRVGGAGWITGYEDNTFRPNNLITRAEVVAIVNRMLNRKADKAYVDNNLMKSKHSFIDNLRSAWYFYDVHEAAVGHAFERQPNGVDEKWNRVTGQAFEIGKDVMYR